MHGWKQEVGVLPLQKIRASPPPNEFLKILILFVDGIISESSEHPLLHDTTLIKT